MYQQLRLDRRFPPHPTDDLRRPPVRRVAGHRRVRPGYITGMSAVRGKPTLVEIDEAILAAVKAEAKRLGMTYRSYFESALARELKASKRVKAAEQLQIAS